MRPEIREQPCRTALNRVQGMPFEWSLNPYMGCVHRCTFCYVRAFERRADRPSDARYGTSIRVKPNVVEVLRAELARPRWAREEVLIGAATDPYQPIEARYRLTRGCIEAFAGAASPFGIVTRGPLVVRDRDVLAHASRRTRVRVDISIPTLDEAFWRATEPGTAPPRQRLRAVRMLADAGIRVGVAMAPLVPGLSDSVASMANVVREARAAGAVGIWAGLLYLRPGTREHFLDELGRLWPEERTRLEQLYAQRAHRPAAEGEHVARKVAALERSFPVRPGTTPLLTPPAEEPPHFAHQLALAL